MKHDPKAPADTRMMPIVHDALRRDLERTRAALECTPFPDGERRIALAEHVGWMMHFLHEHHGGEDSGLWPLMRERDHDAAALLDVMDADHRRVEPAIVEVEAAAAGYGGSDADGDRVALLDAIAALGEVLLPHLRREEDEAMPLVAATLSAADWHDWDQRHNVRGHSLTELGDVGHWLMDGLPPERRAIVTHEVPPVPRFVLVHGFAGRYRRHARVRWGAQAASRTRGRIPRTCSVEAIVSALPGDVWDVIADVTRVGEWSHECRTASWIAGASAPAVGVRFRGGNRSGMIRWTRTNELVDVEPGRTLAWRTRPSLLYPDSTEWRFELSDVGGRTRIVQSYRVLRLPALLDRIYAFTNPGHRDRSDALRKDLQRLGDLATSGPSAGGRADHAVVPGHG